MRTLSLLFLLSLVTLTGFAQNLERYNWYFGSSNQALRFNRTSQVPSIVNKALPFGGGGSATASDPANANLAFYTDGQFVYDASNNQMPGGFGLNANTISNQPVVICPVPGQTLKYFIFTSSASFTTGGTISVSVIDMLLPGNALFPAPFLGDVESKNQAVPGLAARSEAMIIVPHANKTDFWLITHQVNSSTFSATQITPASYTGTYNTVVTSGLSAIPLTAANISYHAGKGKVAVSAQDTSTDAIILNFNNTTGVFSFDRFIFNSASTTVTNQSIYDIEWSATGDFLYLSRFGEPGVPANLLQYDYLNPLTTLTTVLPSPVFRSFGVQIGPDSAIYHLYQSVAAGPILLGKISKADTIASQTNYLPAVLSATSFAGTQFSSFAPKADVTLLVDFDFIGTCQNNKTTFFPKVLPGADSLTWNFGDGTGASNDWSPVYTYKNSGTFNVKLKAFYQGQVDSVSKPVTITPFAIQLNLVQDTTACSCELPFPKKPTPTCNRPFSVTVKATGGTPTSYTWSNGDTGPTLTPDSVGYYYVVVSDASGCSTYAGVNVKEYGVQDQRTNIWYFGQKAGINFNVSPPLAMNKSVMDAPEGCAITCDRNGQVLFYTDGKNVYNKNDVLISPAPGIGGDPLASQSSIIVPVPGDETLYYIFTNEAIDGTSVNTVKYSLFDLKLNAGLGAVVKDNQLLFSKGTERITANGRWLIIHEYGNNTFRVYPISANGIGDPVLTAIGSDHSFGTPLTGMGYMKLGPRNTLAVALATGASNLVELFHLNDTTGKLTRYKKIDLKQPTGQVYGVEFSPGGNKVFATVKGSPTPSQLFEYSIDSVGNPHFKQRIQQSIEMGAIQIAPDGQIYMAINGSGVLGTIQAVDDTTRLSSVNFSGFALKGGTLSRLGLPNFIQQVGNAFGGPSIDITGVCFGTPTLFTGSVTDPIDKVQWFFGDGTGQADSVSTAHTYPAAGNYNVSFLLTNRCGLDTTLVKVATIFTPPPNPTIPGAAVLCNGPVLLDANTANVPALTYAWSDRTTNKTTSVNVQSIVSVIIRDVNGCTSNGSTIVVDNQPKVDIGPDQTLCQNAFTSALNANNPGLTYLWTVNGGSPTSARSRQLDTTVPGVFVYNVVITDALTTCTATDQATFTIIASPLFTMNGTNPTVCNGADGSLAVQLLATAPPTGPYSYFLTGPNAFNQQGIDQAAPQLINVPGLKAGIYSAVIADQVSGCSIAQSFGLSDAPFTATATALAPNCDPVTLQITTNAVSFPLQYTITPVGSGSSVGPIAGIATAVFNTSPVIAGTYTIEVRDNSGCIFTINNFAVTPNAPVAFTITPTICNSPPTISASGATSYLWSGPGIVGPTTGTSIQVSGSGSQTYTVVGSSPGSCDNTQTVTVFLDNPTVSFTQSDPCQDFVNLTAVPSGNYTYRWYKAGVFQAGLLGQTVSVGVSENGASYEAEAVNAVNGCAYKSLPKVVQVFGVINPVFITATLACEDGKPFTLTATTTSTGVTYAWFKNNVLLTGVTTSSTSQTDVGSYRVEITKATTCKSTFEISIIRAPLPVGKLPNRLVICNDPENTDPTTNQVDLDPGRFQAYNWFKNELTLGYTLQVLTATSEGKYRVDITNNFGCVAPDQVEVNNECIPKIEVPNAFRPTSTLSENQQFYVFSFFITDNDFQIFLYNRWGELVYTSSDRYFKWNGGFNGIASQPVPGGSYAYVIRYINAFHPERGIQEKRGGVAVLR